MPSSDGGDDFVWISGPCEGLWLFIVLIEEPVDGGLQIDNRTKDTAFQSALCELGEKPFDGIEPGCRSGREVESPAGMAGKPLAHIGMFVGRIIVDDGMDRLSRRNLPGELIKEAPRLVVKTSALRTMGQSPLHLR